MFPENEDAGETLSFYYEGVDFEVPEPHLWANWLCDVAEAEGFDLDGLTYVFCSDDYLLDINKKYLEHDYYTDIITFPIPLQEDDILAGDLFISIDRVRENADSFGVRFEHELARVMVHGLLHLCGFGDKTEKEQKEMRGAEDFYLERFNKQFTI